MAPQHLEECIGATIAADIAASSGHRTLPGQPVEGLAVVERRRGQAVVVLEMLVHWRMMVADWTAC